MSDGASSEIDCDAETQIAAPSSKCRLLYIDARRLSRDYVSRQLAMHLAEFSIEAAASADDQSLAGRLATHFAVAVAHTHTAHINDPGISTQLFLLAQLMPDVPVVLLSDADAADDIADAFRLGVRGFLPTSLSMKDTAEAIRFVREGGTFIPPSVLAASAAFAATGNSAPNSGGKPSVKFTSRQWEVLQRLWQGKPNKVIAYELEMCESTVKVHIRHIMKKLHARNRTQVVLLTHPKSEGNTRAT
jgi:DNA-binding NarL/FixJ family response regulator